MCLIHDLKFEHRSDKYVNDQGLQYALEISPRNPSHGISFDQDQKKTISTSDLTLRGSWICA